MEIGFARRARDLLEAGGLDVDYHESDAAHHIDPAHIPAAQQLVADVLQPRTAGWPRAGHGRLAVSTQRRRCLP